MVRNKSEIGTRHQQLHEPAVTEAGAAGTVGAAGIVGAAGTVGADGAVGAAGTVGTAGTVGAAGTVGSDGTVAAAGTVAASGTVGAAGAADGAAGAEAGEDDVIAVFLTAASILVASSVHPLPAATSQEQQNFCQNILKLHKHKRSFAGASRTFKGTTLIHFNMKKQLKMNCRSI